MPMQTETSPSPDSKVGAAPKKPVASRRWNSVFMLLFGGVLGAALAGLVVPALRRTELSPWILLLLFLVAWYLVVAVHEAGHLIGGLRVGFRPLVYTVGPLMAQRHGGRWKLERNLLTSAFGGFASAAPDNARNLPARMRSFVAGGPAASLLLFLAGALLYLLAPQTLPGIFAALVALLSFLAGVISLSPLTGDRMLSDGARLQMLRAGGPEAERWCALILLSPVMRPRDYPLELVERLIALADGSYDETIGVCLAYTWAIDRRDLVQAQTLLDRMLAMPTRQLSPVLRAAVLLDAAFFTARFGNDAVQARAFLEEGRSSLPVLRPSLLKTEAVVLRAEGRNEEAVLKAREAMEQLHKVSSPGMVEMMREQLEELLTSLPHISKTL